MIVLGDGTPGTGWAVVGERPGFNEARIGRPFVGPSGLILWRFVEFASEGRLGRRDCWTTNYEKSYDEDNADPELTDAGVTDLVEELRGVGAQHILAVGRFAAWALTGHRSVPIHTMVGRAYPAVGGLNAYVYPAVHPAAALNGGNFDELRWSLWGVQAWAGALNAGYLPPDSRGVHSGQPTIVWNDLGRLDTERLYLDMEGYDTADLIQVCDDWSDDVVFIDRGHFPEFNAFLEKHRPTLVFHHATNDINALHAAGVDTSPCRIEDTMVRAWARCFGAGFDDAFHEKKGGAGGRLLKLKHLHFHYRNTPIVEFKDIAEPVIEQRARDWYRRVHAVLTRRNTHITVSKRGKVKRLPREGVPGNDLALAKRVRSAVRDWRAGKPVQWASRFKTLGEYVQPIGVSIAGEWVTIGNVLPLIPRDTLYEYAAKDPIYTRNVYHDLGAEGPYPASLETDEACLPIFARMGRIGLTVDAKQLETVIADLQGRAREAEDTFRAIVCWGEDYDYSMGHGPSILEALRREFDLPPTIDNTEFPTLKGYANHVEAAHGPDHPLVRATNALFSYRKAQKLESTYAQPIVGRSTVPVKVKHTMVPSGRIAAEDPNLLAWPGRTDIDKLCRSYFVARPGCRLGSWDLDQIEARLLAHYSEDPLLLKIFRDGLDFHSVTAQALLGATIDRETGRAESRLRTPAKTLNYLILYGGGGTVLKRQLEKEGILDYDVDECTRWIEEWYAIYAGVRAYAQASMAEAARCGYVEVPGSGRRRWLPGALFQDETGWPARELTDRSRKQALNHKIQGAAADLIKRAMLRVEGEAQRLRAEGCWFEQLLQIHDEIVVEFDERWEDWTHGMMQWALTAESDNYRVEIGASGNTGRRWSELK